MSISYRVNSEKKWFEEQEAKKLLEEVLKSNVMHYGANEILKTL